MVRRFWKSTIARATTISTGTTTSSARAGETSSRSAPRVAHSAVTLTSGARFPFSWAISRRYP